MMKSNFLEIQPEISKTLDSKSPIVALESTILSHGMPYPENLDTALKVERIIRENGAVPATIAILGGKIKIGLNREELTYLSRSKGIAKVSSRDVPFVVANRLNGATTVAATMIASAMAGIEIFVTGGIGGVHRNASQTFDVSADLTELGRTDVSVVCGGVKSILDIGATLEHLETLGVPVVGYRTNEFPAFFVRKSGLSLENRASTPGEVAGIIKTKRELNLKGGIVVANPIPKEHEMDSWTVEVAIQAALNEAKRKKVTGKAVTPFLLAHIADATGTGSLASNIQLVFSNAKLGAQIACELSVL